MHGEQITAKAMFELRFVCWSILRVSRLEDNRFAVAMGNELGNKMCKNGRGIHLNKSSGVYHVRASCPLEDQDPRPSARAVGEAAAPWTRRLPYKPMTHLVSYLQFRASCSHCLQGLARDWPHSSDYGPPPDIPMVAMDFCFVNT